MNLLDDRSDAVQSQPTQLVDYALAAPPAQLEHDRERRRTSEKQQQDDGFSEDSIVPPRREAVPRYFLYDQAPSTGQNNGRPHGLSEWGPRNENTTPGTEDNKEHYHNVDRTKPSSPLDAQTAVKEPGPSNPIPFTASGTRKVNGVRAISCGPPNSKSSEPPSLAHPTKSMPPMTNRYQRSPSPPSQDSFGGPVSQDPAEQFLAATKQFNVPLSDLGAATQLVDVDLEVPLSDASDHHTSLDSAMAEYKVRRANSRTTSPGLGGKVLVAATPSHTSGSAGSSGVRSADVPFPGNVGADHGSQESTQPFDFDQTPSSFDRLLDKVVAHCATRPAPVPTQTTALDPTPPNASTNVEPPTHPVSGEQSGRQRRSETPQWVSPATHAVVASSNPRSLLRLVNPLNEYRIAKLRQMHGDVAPPSYVSTSARAETQVPSVEEKLPVRSTFEVRHVPSRAGTARRTTKGYQGSPDQEVDSLDVVPDSEPLRAGLSSTPNADVPDSSPRKSSLHARKLTPEHITRDRVSKPPGTQERFNESDDDGDVPLSFKFATKAAGEAPLVQTEARTRASRKPKSLLVATSATTTNNVPILAEDQGQFPANTKERTSVRGKSRSKEPTIVPSSAPEQDLHGKGFHKLPSVGASSRVERKKQKTKDVPAAPRGRSTSAASKAAKRKRPPSSSTESSEDHGSVELSTFVKEEEEETEREREEQEEEEEETSSAHDYDIDVDFPPPAPKAGVPHKRRRVEEIKPSSVSKGSTFVQRSSATPAPGTRSIKRLRSGASTNRAASEPATRVFALWKQDGHYYSGIVHSALPRRGSTKYLVKFDDGTEDEVELKNMRRSELYVGDSVIVSNGARGKVSDVRELESRGIFLVKVDDGEKTVASEVELADIRIANRVLQNQWKDRILNPEAIVTVIKPRLLTDTATPSHHSLASLPGRPQRELAKTGFVVTLSPKNSNPEQTKESMIKAIEHYGGQLIDDWSGVFTMDGRHSQSNKRWTVTPDDFHFKEGVTLDRVFLLADDANQKPKFLIALALGIPCLSFEWLTKASKFSEDWQPFLLSAGYSDVLSARVSQLVDLDWGNCSEYLQDILSNRVAPKLFSDKKFLCVGADFVPPHRGRKNASNIGRVREATRAVPWIILCMGASKVDAVTDTKQVSSKELRTFDYVIVKDTADVEDLRAVTVATVTWIKECLISSRIVPTNWTQS